MIGPFRYHWDFPSKGRGRSLSFSSAWPQPPESCRQWVYQHHHPKFTPRRPPWCPARTHSWRSFAPFLSWTSSLFPDSFGSSSSGWPHPWFSPSPTSRSASTRWRTSAAVCFTTQVLECDVLQLGVQLVVLGHHLVVLEDLLGDHLLGLLTN